MRVANQVPQRADVVPSSPLSVAEACEGLVVRSLRVAAADVVFVKGIVEASEGVAGLFAERGGDLVLAAPGERTEALDELVADLEAELGLAARGRASRQEPPAA